MASSQKDPVEPSTSNDILKREPTHDEAREAREFQEERAGAGGSDNAAADSLNEDQNQHAETTKGNRR